jgi:hypothetical protein
MAFPNATDIIATTIESRSKKIADNVSKNTALLTRIKEKGGQRTFSGGSSIMEPLSFAENGNFAWYSGADLLPVAAQDVISAAQYPIKQAAVSVLVTGLDALQNSGAEQRLDLIEARVKVAETTMKNQITGGAYSDGTGYGGKQIAGLLAAVPSTVTTGVFGSIDRAIWPFWRPQSMTGVAYTSANMLAGPTAGANNGWNGMWALLTRNADRPDLIMVDNFWWNNYVNALQPNQRFLDPEKTAKFGFMSLKFMDADVVLDGGLGGFCPPKTCYFLNTNYLFFRPHKDRNMVPLNPSRKYALNQDAEVVVMGFAGNFTVSNESLQGVIVSN